MAFRIAADALVALHFAFILFVVLGGLLTWRHRWMSWIHLPAAAWGCLIEFAGWTCPLTPLEIRWRIAAGQAGFEGGFIEHYMIPVIYPQGLSRGIQFWLGAIVLLFNLFVYSVYFRRRASARRVRR